MKARMQLSITPPFGDVVPDTESLEPIVLLSAGVGIAPMNSILNRIRQVRPERHVWFAHTVRDSRFHAHQKDLQAVRAAMPHLKVAVFMKIGKRMRHPLASFQVAWIAGACCTGLM